MKTTIFIFLTTLLPLFASKVEWTDELRAIESQQVKLWRDTLESVRDSMPPEQIASLWLGLRNMGYRRENYDGHSVEVDRIYEEIQSAILSIPGHARYFAEEIKREQKEVTKYPTTTGPRGTYDFNRGIYFLTMRHLPSPETIAVLGDFLADDKDQPGPRDPSKSYDYDIPPANCYYAAETLDKIGLRNPPVPPARHQVFPLAPEDYLPYALAWWEEIKSGNKTFSFVGQDVEYRFKPDGTWDTIPIANPPDKGAKPDSAATKDRPVKRPAVAPLESREASDGPKWWWYAMVGIALLALGAWFWRKKTA